MLGSSFQSNIGRKRQLIECSKNSLEYTIPSSTRLSFEGGWWWTRWKFPSTSSAPGRRWSSSGWLVEMKGKQIHLSKPQWYPQDNGNTRFEGYFSMFAKIPIHYLDDEWDNRCLKQEQLTIVLRWVSEDFEVNEGMYHVPIEADTLTKAAKDTPLQNECTSVQVERPMLWWGQCNEWFQIWRCKQKSSLYPLLWPFS